MHIHTITVSFMRSKQPADYESAKPEAELTASLSEDDNAAAAIKDLMAMACSTVYAALGYELPPNAATMLGYSVTSGETVAVTTPIAGAPAADPEAVKKAEKAAKAAAKKAEKAAAKEAATKPDASDIPGSDTPPAATTAADDIPGSDSPPAVAAVDDGGVPDVAKPNTDDGDSTLTIEDLNALVGKYIAEQKLKVPQVKEVLSEFGVARISDLQPGYRAMFKASIEGKVNGPSA